MAPHRLPAASLACLLLAAAPARARPVGPNVDVSADPTRIHSETAAAIHRGAAGEALGACNQVNAAPVMVFRTGDLGATWTGVELPLGPAQFQSGPSLAWDTQGNAYAGALGVLCSDPGCTSIDVGIQVAKSLDGGRTWSAPASPGTAPDYDRMRMAANDLPGACADLVCAAWPELTSPTRIHAACSPGGLGPWVQTVLATGPLLVGPAPAFGPDGEVYVLWHDARETQPGQSGFGISRSADCGLTWSPFVRFGPSRSYLSLVIPAVCIRRTSMFPSLAVDRSPGPRRGWLYAVYTDSAPGTTCIDFRRACGGCPSSACATDCQTNVYLVRSNDAGQTWSAPVPVHTDVPDSDQFNGAIAIDDADGTIHVTWNDTRGDPARLQTHVYHRSSADGGATWSAEEPVTTAPTDETPVGAGADANQYGEHNGLSSHGCRTLALWTDRRSGGNEQAWAAVVSDASPTCCAGVAPPALGNTLRAARDAMLRPALSWTDLGGAESDYRVYRGAAPDFAGVPPSLLGASGGPDAVAFTDPAAPSAPGVSYYRVRAIGACGEEATGW